MAQSSYFPPKGVSGTLKCGIDGKFYFIPNDRRHLWDISSEYDVATHSCGDFENSVEVQFVK